MKNVLSLKGKIAAGIAAATILGSTGVAFANTTAGDQFKAWGDAKITAAMTAVSDLIAGKLPTAQANVKLKANGELDKAKGNIDTAGQKEKEDTKKKIEDELARHITSLQTALKTFMDNIGGDFDDLVKAENDTTTKTLDKQYAELESNINSVLTNAKNTNVKDVTEASLLVKGKATSDLIKEINRVKSVLSAEITKQQNDASGEVSDHLEAEVKRINEQLDKLIGGLESSAIDAIAKAGKAVEDSAILNFDKIVNLSVKENPIVVDAHKLTWVAEKLRDKKVKFTVTNTNEFDVVFRYAFVNGNVNGGVSETTYDEMNAKQGVTELVFDTDQLEALGFKWDVGGVLVTQYLDENGQFKYGTEIGLY